jgi:hypothetical protein
MDFAITESGAGIMFAVLVAIALLLVSVAEVYLLLKSMGQDGVEAAAPVLSRS